MTGVGLSSAYDTPAVVAGERRVRYARFRPAVPEGAWALRLAMEDALRCASFDDAGRLVLVRRLRILGLPARAGAGGFGRALERAWREAARQAVPALAGPDMAFAEEAAQATAVWFPSPAEAVLAALVRSIEGSSLSAWFWPSAVPMLAEVPAVAERVPLLLAQLQALAPRTWQQAVARWPPALQLRLQRWTMPGGEVRCAEGEPPVLGAAVPRPVAALPVQPSFLVDKRAAVVETPASPIRAPAAPLSAGMLPSDKHSPPTASDPPEAERSTVGHAAAPSARGQAHPVSADAPEVPQARRPLHAARDVSPLFFARGTSPEVTPATVVPVTAQPVVSPSAPRPPRRIAAARPPIAAPFPWLHDALFSPHAGALWLVRLLDAVGFGATRPDPGSAFAVLGGLFRTAGLADEDPHWDLLPPDAVPPAPRETRPWQIQARRTLRRRAGLSVAELARRPGWITLTLTHADIVLPLDTVDLRVRRLGLDSDPGYVPWLGRILRFHFVARADWPEPG